MELDKKKKIILSIAVIVLITILFCVYMIYENNNNQIDIEDIVSNNDLNKIELTSEQKSLQNDIEEVNSITGLENSVEEIESNNNKIYIHIIGEVKKPGVVQLNLGDRVIDAIKQAGGETKQADLSQVNLAYKVESKMKSIFKITLTIADVDGGNVILLAGKNHGVSSKTRFKVYSKKEDIILPSGNVISGGYNYKGTLRIKELNNEYSIAKISRGNNILPGDIARETVIGDFGFGIFLNYASYNIQATEKIYQSSYNPNAGKIKISLKKNEYALGLHLKMGYNGVLFSPNLSIGILFGDFLKSSYAVDTRFNFDININLYQEVLRFVIAPYIGMGISFTTIGEVIGGNYYTDSYSYLKSGSKIDSRDIMFGIGAIASLQYNVTDTIGLNLGVGYRFYTNPINLGVFSDGHEVSLPEKIKTVNLTGLEFTFGAFFIL